MVAQKDYQPPKVCRHVQQSAPCPILLIDDEPINIEVLSLMLKKKGYSSDVATRGGKGIERVIERFE